MTQMLVNSHNGKRRTVHNGFSWTTMLFGFWPALFRGDWFHAVVFFLSFVVVGGMLTGIHWIFGVITILVWIYPASKYNEWHAARLRNDGFDRMEQSQ